MTSKQLGGGDKNPQKYKINNINLKCQICQHNLFLYRTAQLNTKLYTFFDLEWLNKNAHILTCEKCTYLMWFNKKPDAI